MAKEAIRQDTAVSIRTPRARVRGLGVSHHGAGHWWLQRLTAVANVVLMLAFVVIIARMAGRPYPEAIRLVGSPFVSLILILAVLRIIARLRARRPAQHVLVTGRNAKPALIEAADLVTEMTLVKHHFSAGVKAQEGIEF